MRPESPPEQWLLKAYDGEILVDLIFEPSGMRIDDDLRETTASSPFAVAFFALADGLGICPGSQQPAAVES